MNRVNSRNDLRYDDNTINTIAVIIIIILIIYIHQVIKISGVKTKKAKMKMSDGHGSGRVSCKSTQLKRCSMVEMRWYKYEVSLASPV